VHDAGLGHGVTGIGDDAQGRFRPSAGEIVGDLDRRHHVVTAMHDHAGDVPQPMRVGNQLIVGMEEAAIDEVVALDAGEGQRVVVFGEAAYPLGVGKQRKCLAFPGAPGPGGIELHGGIGIGQAPVKSLDQIAALGLGDHA